VIILPYVPHGRELIGKDDNSSIERSDFQIILERIANLQKDIEDLKKNMFYNKPIYAMGICGICKLANQQLIKHHISYYPELTILVCHKCHKDIHNATEYPLKLLLPPKADIARFYNYEEVLKNE
jgi:hypothetical protein